MRFRGRIRAWDARVIGWRNAVRAKTRQGVMAPGEIVDVRHALDEMRLIKDAPTKWPRCVAPPRFPTARTVRAMRAVRACGHEYEVEAEVAFCFSPWRCGGPGLRSIVAGGANACVLHYVFNNALMDGDLLLIDAGGEMDRLCGGYHSHLSGNGRYGRAERRIRIGARRAGRRHRCRPNGANWNAPHEAACGCWRRE